MVIDMNETRLTTLGQVRAFLAGTVEVRFCVAGEGEDGRYRHIAAVLTRFVYKRLKKPGIWGHGIWHHGIWGHGIWGQTRFPRPPHSKQRIK